MGPQLDAAEVKTNRGNSCHRECLLFLNFGSVEVCELLGGLSNHNQELP